LKVLGLIGTLFLYLASLIQSRVDSDVFQSANVNYFKLIVQL